MSNDIPTGRNVIFLVGAARSGTTWLQRLLASHPRIHTGQESYVFSRYVGPPLRKWNEESRREKKTLRQVGMRCYLSDRDFHRILMDYMREMMEPMTGDLEDGHFFLEKTPEHALWLPEIHEALPESKIIHIVRDPRDVVYSTLRSRNTWAKHFPSTTRSAIGWWKESAMAAHSYADEIPSNQFREIHYEGLLADAAGTLSHLAEFIGVDWSRQEIESTVDRNSADKPQSSWTSIPLGGEASQFTASEKVVEPQGFIGTAGAGGWKEKLSFIQKLQIWFLIRNEMKEFGYEWRYPW